jgi:hypothetical protein
MFCAKIRCELSRIAADAGYLCRHFPDDLQFRCANATILVKF